MCRNVTRTRTCQSSWLCGNNWRQVRERCSVVTRRRELTERQSWSAMGILAAPRCQREWAFLHTAASEMSSRMLLLIAVSLAGCASSYQVVQVPQREADLLPLSDTRQGVSVAVDEITSADRAASYFGADLLRVGIVPLVV